MNVIAIKGRITKDIELKQTSTDKAYAIFTVAVDRAFSKDKKTDFISCKAWGKSAENIANYLSKGSEIALTGALNIDEYEKDGEKKSFTFVNVSAFDFCGKGNGGTPKTDEIEIKDGEIELPF